MPAPCLNGELAMLCDVLGVTVHDLGPDPAAIVTFTLPGMDAAAVAARLAESAINVSVSATSSTPIDSKPSSV